MAQLVRVWELLNGRGRRSLPRDTNDYVERLRRLKSMLRLRSFESALLRQPKPGFQLLSRGEEAIAVGVCAALERTDALLCSGRSIAIALARGVPPGRCWRS